MTLALIILALLQICDVLSTIRVLEAGGYERNPVVAKLMDRFGRFWWVPKIVLAAAAAALVWWAGAVPLLWVLNAVYAAVVVNNLRQV